MTVKARTRINLALDTVLLERLLAFAAKRDIAKSAALEAAIASFLDHDEEPRQEAPLARRLDRLSLHIARLDEDITILGEAVALFVRFWLSATAPLAASAQADAHARGAERYDAFLQSLGRRLAQGDSFLREVSYEANSRLDSQSSDAVPADPPP